MEIETIETVLTRCDNLHFVERVYFKGNYLGDISQDDPKVKMYVFRVTTGNWEIRALDLHLMYSLLNKHCRG